MSAVRLVVERELREKLRSKAFWVMNAILVVLLVGVAVLPVVLGDDDEQSVVPVAATGDQAVTIVEQAVALGSDDAGLVIEIVEVADRTAAEEALRAERVELALVGPDEIVGVAEPGGLVVELLAGARRVALLDAALAEAGVPVAERAAAVAPPPLRLTALDDEGEGPSGAATATGLAAVFVLYGLLIFYGQQIAQGIVQEKQSRVIEVLLATLRPVELLGGKLLGLGLLGLFQVAGLSIVGYAALALSGRETIPPEALPTLAVAVAFFVLGYALYSTIFALAAATVAKIEDLQTAMTVPILLLVGSFFLAQFSLTDPDGTLSVVAGMLPPSAPIVQPLRVAVGSADWVSATVGTVSVVVTTALLVPVAARVHAGAALVVRQRISVGEALRRHRD